MLSVTFLSASMITKTASLHLLLSIASSIRNIPGRALSEARSETANATGNVSELNATTTEVTAIIKTFDKKTHCTLGCLHRMVGSDICD